MNLKVNCRIVWLCQNFNSHKQFCYGLFRTRHTFESVWQFLYYFKKLIFVPKWLNIEQIYKPCGHTGVVGIWLSQNCSLADLLYCQRQRLILIWDTIFYFNFNTTASTHQINASESIFILIAIAIAIAIWIFTITDFLCADALIIWTR